MPSVTYDSGPYQITAPTTWADVARANAVCELEQGHPLTEPLAMLAMLEVLGVNRRTPEDVARERAGEMLRDGWCPGDERGA